VHLVEDSWTLPQTGQEVFTESGTYAPIFRVGPYTDDDGATHIFLCDGYAASAEAMQAASLDPVLDLSTSMCLFSSQFKASVEREQHIITLDPESETFDEELAATLDSELTPDLATAYRASLRSAREAMMPVDRRTITADDFFPLKEWRVLALDGYLLPDPYSGAEGVEQLADDRYRVTTRAATRLGVIDATLEFRLMEPFEEMRMVFSPLLDRFYSGQDYRQRAVKISDSGRIRNELQTLCSEAIEYLPDDRMLLRFDQIDASVLPADKRDLIREVLVWYKANHPTWFNWLEMK
jgi:hypothetical protein